MVYWQQQIKLHGNKMLICTKYKRSKQKNAYVILKFQYYKSTLISLGPMYCSSRSEQILILV